MKTCFFLFACIISISVTAQQSYWQQYLRFNINVELHDTEKILTGDEKIVYKNYSPDTLGYIWFHLYPNAYSNEFTALYNQIKDEPEHKSNLDNYERGYIKNVEFKVNGTLAKTEPHPEKKYIDIVKVILPKALMPGDSVLISTPFTVKMPSYFSRMGYSNGEFMACQWYPKPAVYDQEGWHEMPYLDMGEFYSEYATYTVNITLPSSYVVSATGILQNEEELLAYKMLGTWNAGNPKKAKLFIPAKQDVNKTLTYIADNVPDFAWFADKSFIIQYDTIILKNSKVADVFTFYHDKRSAWTNSLEYVKDAVRYYSRNIGEYAYPVVQAVDGPKNSSSGGMEYPMVTLINMPEAKAEQLDAVIAHEVGHNWFMAMLATNERMYPWLDEGLNTYFEIQYEAEKYRNISMLGAGMPAQMKKMETRQFLEFVFEALVKIPIQPALMTASQNYENSEAYGATSYIKGASWVYLLERAVGKEKVILCFQHYFNQWKFKHPRPRDMQHAFEEVLQGKLNQYFLLLQKEGKLDY